MDKRWIIRIVVGSILLAALVATYLLVLKPRQELKAAAQDTCDQLDGAIMLQVGPILSSATKKAERLGFTGPELGEQMRELCPDTMSALERWSSSH
jgi:hypothetical protein